MSAPTMIGILGGGQLGRMLALAGYPLGFRFRFLDTAPDAPTGPLGELFVGDFRDSEVLARFLDSVDVVTYEVETIPEATARFAEERCPVRPGPRALAVSQDRLVEKRFLESVGVPIAAFAAVESVEELRDGLAATGLPAVLKTRRLGYDGRGQCVVRTWEDAARAYQSLGGADLILERFVPFDREVSILSVRGLDGEVRFYPLVENRHEGGILRLSRAPAPASTDLQAEAERFARAVLENLDYAGVLAIEFFQLGDRLFANEMAPRVHNSGHWTIEGAETSQFENHLRAICGYPLGSTQCVGRSAMVNLIGTVPSTQAILSVPGAHLHLYGKTEKPGRKLGHVTLRDDDPESLRAGVERITAAVGAALDPV